MDVKDIMPQGQYNAAERGVRVDEKLFPLLTKYCLNA